MLEPVLREPGNIAFQWMEIQRTRSSLLQQLDAQSNNEALNETLAEFGIELRGAEPECEYKCPELNACIDRDLWCDGECVTQLCAGGLRTGSWIGIGEIKVRAGRRAGPQAGTSGMEPEVH